MQGKQIDKSTIEKISTIKMFSIPTVIKEVKPPVLEKYEFENREKIELESSLWNFRTIRLLMQQRKTLVL